MSLEQSIVSKESELPGIHETDKSGLDEIEKALKEIKKLQSEQEETKEKGGSIDRLDLEQQGDAAADLEAEVEAEELAGEEADTKADTEKKASEKKESKIWKEKKRKYQAIAEKEALLQENMYNGPQNLDTKMRQERYNFPKNNEIIINGELTNAEESKAI